LYRRCDEIGRRENVLLTTHLAESREEMEMFLHSRGPLADFLAGLGRDNADLRGATPIAHASEFCEFDERWLLVHVNEIVMDDLERLLRPETQPHIVHCPRSREYFGHSPFKFGKFRKLGFNICLATDSLASNENLSLFAEMRAFQRYRPKVSPKEILEMVTVNPARALHQENALAQIRPGFQADLIAIPCIASTNVFEEIVSFNGLVDWMMIGGKRQ
jgi:cytosine/adenosine deaminase-related metal-dependent hydrolase